MLTIQSYWIIGSIIILCCVIFPTRRYFYSRIIKRKKKGAKNKMPVQMIKEFIGKNCTISLFNEVGGAQGTITAIEENWIKLENAKKIRFINGDMIRDITISK